MKTSLKILIFALLSFNSIDAICQDFPIENNIFISAPYPISLDAYLDNLELGIIQVTSSYTEERPVYFSFSFRETSGLVSLTSDETLNDPVFIQPGINIFTPEQVQNLFADFTSDNFNVTGLTQEEQNAILLNRQIPEGEYEICLFAFDELGNPLSDQNIDCFTFDVIYGERPNIWYPFDYSVLYGYEYIMWMQNVNSFDDFNRLEYTLKIIDLTEEGVAEEDAELAMLNEQTPSIYNETFTGEYLAPLFNEMDIFFIDGNQYAARVSVTDPLGELAFQFGGHSEIRFYSFKGEDIPEVVFDAPVITNGSEIFFSEDSPVEIEWTHDQGASTSSLSYSSRIVEITDESPTLDQILDGSVSSIWESEDLIYQESIIIDGEDVEWEVDASYAMIISVISDNEDDEFENNGHSQIYDFTLINPEGGNDDDDDNDDDEGEETLALPLITAPFLTVTDVNNVINIEPVTTTTQPATLADGTVPAPVTTISYQVSVKWEHGLDLEATSDTIVKTTYELQILDFAENIGTADIGDFTSPNYTKIYNEAILPSAGLTVIKPTTPKTFLPGHTYVMTIKASYTPTDPEGEAEIYPNDGFSDFIMFSFPENDIVTASTPLPEISYPIDNSFIDDDNIVRLDWDHIVADSVYLVTSYKCQIIDLTDRGIESAESKHFVWAGAKVYDGVINKSNEIQYINISSEINTVTPKIILQKDHKYAIAIKATSSALDIANYSNDGYSNIRTWTYSDQLPLPYIITPENPTVNLNANLDLKWDHALDTIQPSNDFAVDYWLKIMDLEQLVPNTQGEMQKIQPTIENFKSPENNKIYNQIITEKQMSITPNNAFELSHKYAIVLQAIPSNSAIVLPNEGFSEIVLYTHDAADEDGCPVSAAITNLPTDQISFPITDTSIKNKTYKMGDLDFKISKLYTLGSHTGDGYAGTGSITIGFLSGIKIKVDFENIKVNASGNVIAGVAIAKKKSLPSLDKVATSIANKVNMDPEVATELTGLLKGADFLVSKLRGKSTTLPIGYDKEDAVVGITDMEFTPTQNSMVAMFSLENPEWGDYVPSFAADKILFKDGGFAPNIRLSLFDDFAIETDIGAFVIKGTDLENSSTEQGTYVELNCKGFKRAQLSVSYFVDREYLLPVDTEGDVIADEETRVEINLAGQATVGGNFMFKSFFTPCEIPGLEGFSVGLEEGAFDLSDIANPENIQFPNGYNGLPSDPLWRGLFVRQFNITAPRDFGGGSEEDRTSIVVNNFILDDTGVSIDISALNLLAIDKGNIEGFAISVDELNVQIVQNQFKKASLDGRMGAPILNDGEYFYYTGLLSKDGKPITTPNNTTTGSALSYSLTVTPEPEGYYVPAVKSNLLFNEDTQISVYKNSKERGVSMIIEGELQIGNTKGNADSSVEDMEIDFPSITFTGFSLQKIQTLAAPTTQGQTPPPAPAKVPLEITPPTFALAGLPFYDPTGGAADDQDVEEEDTPEPQIAGFKIGLRNLDMQVDKSQEGTEEIVALDLNIGAELNIVRPPKGSTQKGFELSAEGGVNIVGEIRKKPDEIYRFVSAEIVGGDLSVDSQVGPIGIAGSIEFYTNDEIFGTGVVGDATVSIENLMQATLQARFGSKPIYENSIDRFLYFYLFGEVVLDNGFPVGQSGLFLNSFNGGFYYKMSNSASDFNPETDDPATGDPETDDNEVVDINDPKNIYAPDNTTKFGVKAGIGFYYTKPEVIYAKTGIGFEINSQGGLKNVNLSGIMTMASTDPFSGPFVDGIRLSTNVDIDFADQIELHATFGAQMNLVDGMIKGAYPDYKILESGGRLDITGESFGLEFGSYEVPGLIKANAAGLLEVDGSFYLQASAGKPVTFTHPGPPKFITDILDEVREEGGNEKFTFSNPNEDPLVFSDAFAIAAGMNITAKSDINFSILYANFEAQLGMDVSLLPMTGISCKNLEGKLGMGNEQYYARGQAYAGLRGGVGLDVDVFGYKGKISLAEIKAAMLLQAGLPNPVWARGQAAMAYSVLGGIVSGNTSFEISIGEECDQYLADPLAGINFIEGITPKTSQNTPVSIFVKPRLSLVNKLGAYTFYDEAQNNKKLEYKIILEDYTISGPEVSNVSYDLQDDGLSYIMRFSRLREQTEYTLSATVIAQRKNDSGVWENTDYSETVTETFKTGDAPNYVPWENVTNLYPFRDEQYYMIGDNKENEGLIALGSNQKELFEPFTPEGQQWHSKAQVVFSTIGSVRTNYIFHGQEFYYYAPVTISVADPIDLTYGHFAPLDLNLIYYDFPTDQLVTNKRYTIQVKRIWYQNEAFNTNEQELTDLVVLQEDDSEYGYTITNEGKSYEKAEEEKPEDILLFSYDFTTSNFNSFFDKVGTITGCEWDKDQSDYMFDMQEESFSQIEVGGSYISESGSEVPSRAFLHENLEELYGKPFYDYYQDRRNACIAKNNYLYKNYPAMDLRTNYRGYISLSGGLMFSDMNNREQYGMGDSYISSYINGNFPTDSDIDRLGYFVSVAGVGHGGHLFYSNGNPKKDIRKHYTDWHERPGGPTSIGGEMQYGVPQRQWTSHGLSKFQMTTYQNQNIDFNTSLNKKLD